MAAINTGNHDRVHSLEHMFNQSFDREFQIIGTELIGFDPLAGEAGALKRVTVNALGEYQVNDMAEVPASSLTYVGKEDPSGNWYIQKIDESSGTSIRYATVRNNASYTAYSNAWTDRADLTYGTYSEAF